MDHFIHIIAVSDDRYAQHLGVMLVSLLEQTNRREDIRVHVISGDVSEDNRRRLEQLVVRYGSHIEFVQIDPALFANFGVRNNMSHAAYYKIAIPQLFSFDKGIFLDCDLIMKEDIEQLWNIDVTGAALAAVKDHFFDRHEQLGIPATAETFNSGVMLINLAEWRRLRVMERAMEFLHHRSHHIALHDQDALNAVLYNKWHKLPPRWNHFTLSWSKSSPEHLLQENPAIIHFATSKPWYYLNDHPMKDEYYTYLQKTPWKDYVPPDQEMAERLLQKSIIVVYGTGSGGERVAKLLDRFGVGISYFVDGNPEKWGSAFLGKPVHPPEKLLEEDDPAVFVASYSFYDQIALRLRELGFVEGKHFLAGLGRR